MPNKADKKNDDDIICYCRNVNRKVIVAAIEAGCSSLQQVQKVTGAGSGNQCLELNPKGICCHQDIIDLINTYSKQTTNAKKHVKCCCNPNKKGVEK